MNLLQLRQLIEPEHESGLFIFNHMSSVIDGQLILEEVQPGREPSIQL